MGESVIQAEAVSKSFRRGDSVVHAVQGVTMTVSPGELVAIMGPSGCGKSTLLHLLAGIDTPTSGRVVLRGDVLNEKSDEARATLRRERMGLLFQGHALLPGLSVADNVALPLALAGMDGATCRSRSVEMLTLVGLAERGRDLPDDLSGGQRQRVALARALINKPIVVLADEPTGSLDSVTAQAVLDAMIPLLRQTGTALVMVTHDREVAAQVDRIITLRDGHIEETPPASAVSGEVSL